MRLQVLFYVSVGFIVLVYAGYPMLVWVLAGVRASGRPRKVSHAFSR